MLGELVGGEVAGGVGVGQDEGAEQDALGLADGLLAVGGQAFGALGGGLLELLAQEGGVDAELLGGVGGELVAVDGRWACGGCGAGGS